MAKALARSIKTKRDYHGATSVANKTREQPAQEPESERRLQALLDEIANKTREQPAQEPESERRLQALLDEIEKFDEVQDDSFDGAEDADSLPRRRWSDELSDGD
jgi:hypothetical protein